MHGRVGIHAWLLDHLSYIQKTTTWDWSNVTQNQCLQTRLHCGEAASRWTQITGGTAKGWTKPDPVNVDLVPATTIAGHCKPYAAYS